MKKVILKRDDVEAIESPKFDLGDKWDAEIDRYADTISLARRKRTIEHGFGKPAGSKMAHDIAVNLSKGANPILDEVDSCWEDVKIVCEKVNDENLSVCKVIDLYDDKVIAVVPVPTDGQYLIVRDAIYRHRKTYIDSVELEL